MMSRFTPQSCAGVTGAKRQPARAGRQEFATTPSAATRGETAWGAMGKVHD